VTAIAADPTTTRGYRPVSSSVISATALPEERSTRVVVADFGGAPVPGWWFSVADRLNELLELAPGWDTYGAPSIEFDHVVHAVNLLLNLAPDDAPPPWIAPTARRGIQMEWDLGDVELELSIDDTGASIFVADQVGEDEGELSQRSDLWRRAALAIETVAIAE